MTHETRILVVEVSAIHSLLMRIFGLAGLQINCVDNWEDAASRLREGQFLYLLADFRMPGVVAQERTGERGEIRTDPAAPDVAREVRIDGVTLMLIRPFTIRTIMELAPLNEGTPDGKISLR